MRVLFVGQDPETVDFSDPSLPADTTAEKIQAGIELAQKHIADRGWAGDNCMIPPTDAGIDTLKRQLTSQAYDCVVIGGGVRIPPKSLLLFERIVNTVHYETPNAAIAFNTSPDDTADAAARWLDTLS